MRWYSDNHNPHFLNQTLISLWLKGHTQHLENTLTTPSRLARRGGVKRISATIYEEARTALKARLEIVLLTSSFTSGLSDQSIDPQRLRYLCRTPERKDGHCLRCMSPLRPHSANRLSDQ